MVKQQQRAGAAPVAGIRVVDCAANFFATDGITSKSDSAAMC